MQACKAIISALGAGGAAALLLVAGSAVAQPPSGAASANPASANTASANATGANTTGADASSSADAARPSHYDLDTPIEAIAADPAGKAVLDRDLPGLTTHPMYEQFKTMSLNDVQPMSQGAITDPALAKTKVDLAKVTPK